MKWVRKTTTGGNELLNDCLRSANNMTRQIYFFLFTRNVRIRVISSGTVICV